MGKLNRNGAPQEPIADLRRRMEKLEAEVRRMRSSSSFLENATIGRGGLTVKGEGGVRMVAPDGTVIFAVTCNPNSPDPDGNPQPSVFIFRNDGTLAFSLEDPSPTVDGYHQILRLWDRAGHEIFAEDATSGQGIANPWIPFPMYLARYTDWPKTTSGTFENIWQGNLSVKNPTLTVGAFHTADASGTTGEIRCQVNGSTFGTTVSVGFVITQSYLCSQVPWPAGVNINDTVSVTVQARRTGGSGNVMVSPLFSAGSQSA